MRSSTYGIGRYNERRPTMYNAPQYAVGEVRNIHMGIDIAAPVGVAVRAFYKGTIYRFGDNRAHQDYGPTIVTKHNFLSQVVYALHGHLSRESLANLVVGQPIEAGDIIGHIGEKSENGGWNPHLHFQLSRLAPATHDLPGVVSARQHAAALVVFPDPRLVLGNLYVD
ncbi:MAG: peptidoglycan DD-metalloendopeptidase family protein [Myxococcota bacterium]|nr:peptidoglycan DD-metalloendopeptidase family protein [Myxococcota bacterium]